MRTLNWPFIAVAAFLAAFWAIPALIWIWSL